LPNETSIHRPVKWLLGLIKLADYFDKLKLNFTDIEHCKNILDKWGVLCISKSLNIKYDKDG